MGEDLVELAADRAFAGRVSLAFDVSGILKEREDAFFAIFGKGVQVEEFVIGGSGVDFEITSMDDDTEWAVDGERDAIDETVRDLDGMNCESSKLDAFVGTHLTKIGVVEQTVFIEFVFDVRKG